MSNESDIDGCVVYVSRETLASRARSGAARSAAETSAQLVCGLRSGARGPRSERLRATTEARPCARGGGILARGRGRNRSERGAPERSEAQTAGGFTPPAGQRPKGAKGRGAGGRGQGPPQTTDPCNSTAGAARRQAGTTSLLSAAARGARPRRPSDAVSERSRAWRGGASATHPKAPCCCAWMADEETRSRP